jgi:hypothetical protein
MFRLSIPYFRYLEIFWAVLYDSSPGNNVMQNIKIINNVGKQFLLEGVTNHAM